MSKEGSLFSMFRRHFTRVSFHSNSFSDDHKNGKIETTVIVIFILGAQLQFILNIIFDQELGQDIAAPLQVINLLRR